MSFDWGKYQEVPSEESGSQQSFDWNSYEEEPKPFLKLDSAKEIPRKAGRLFAQTIPGAADVASLPLTAGIAGAQALSSGHERNRLKAIERNKWRKENPEEAEELKKKEDPYGFAERRDLAFEEQEEMLKKKGLLPEWMRQQDWTPGGIVKTALESAGVDMEPEDVAESAAKWLGFIKDPKKWPTLLQNPSKILQSPQEALKFAKNILPTGKEAARSAGAAVLMDAVGDEFGPIGSLAVGILGDYLGGGAVGAFKKAAQFIKAPIQTSRELMARGAVRFTSKDKLDMQQKIVEDFRKSGIQADLGTITDSNLMRGLQARLGSSSLVGKELEGFIESQKNQIIGQYERVANQLGKAKFSSLQEAGEEMVEKMREIRDKDMGDYRRLYQDAMSEAEGSGAQVLPAKLANAVENLKKRLSPGAVKGPEQKAVLDYLEKLETDILSKEGALKRADVQALINNKVALGDIINYEVQGGAKQLLKGIAKELDDAILEYGHQKPSFAKNYAAANAKFSKHAQEFRNRNINDIIKGKDPAQLMSKMNTPQGIREIGEALNRTKEGQELFKDLKRFKLDEIFRKNMVDSITEQMKLGKFTNILEKGKNREIVKELLSPASFNRLQNLQKMTGRLADSAYKFYNASKSASTALDIAAYGKVLLDLGHLISGNPWPLVRSGAIYGASRSLSKLLADPEFLIMVEDHILQAPKASPKKLQSMAEQFKKRFAPTLSEDIDIAAP